MGKEGKSRRALIRKKKRSGEKAAKKARYAAYVGMAENVKSKRWQKKTKGGKKVNPFAKKKRSKRMAEPKLVHAGFTDDGRSFVNPHVVQRTWKQTHNTTNLKTFMKQLRRKK
jgi:hypothetical protein